MKNTIKHNIIHKVFHLFLALILLTTSLHAEPTFTLEDMVVLISSLISIVLLIISFIIRVFKKNNTLIYISLSFLFLLNTILFLSDIPERFKINSHHYFQEPNTYGVYEGNETIASTEQLNIIHMTEQYNDFPNLLDDNNTIYLHDMSLKIHVNELKKLTYFIMYSGYLHIFGKEDKNIPEMVSYSPVVDNANHITNYEYDKKSTDNQLYRFNQYLDKYQEYKHTFRSKDNINFGNYKKLKSAFLKYEPIVLIDKENKQLRLFQRNNSEKFRPFHVPYTPKVALYKSSYNHRDGDKIFIAYEEVPGVYILENINTKEYTHLQTMVKELIDTSVKSPELVQTLNIHTLKSEKLETLREILMRKPSITYDYSVDISKNQAYVYVSSKDFPLLHIIFIFTKTDKWVISDVLYEDKEHLSILGSWQ
jgi:hypothetical protein